MKKENSFNRLLKPNRVLIVAELSANHNGSLDVAIETIKAAKRAGADAIKLQTYTADTITLDCDNDYFMIKGGPWDGKNLYKLYQEAHTPWEWHEALINTASKEDLLCFSSPFDRTAVDFLEQFNPPAYKIASFEIFDIPLIEYIAAQHRPVILSTGMATIKDVELAVNTCRAQGNDAIIVLKCTSSYPARLEDANLAAMAEMKDRLDVEIGLSDHTTGSLVPIVAASMGARLIEKHIILDRSLGGPDASFSMEIDEFREMVESVRKVESILGTPDLSLSESAQENLKFARSLFVVKPIEIGGLFTTENIRSIRPGFGLHPKHYSDVVGKRSTRKLMPGTPLSWEHIEKK